MENEHELTPKQNELMKCLLAVYDSVDKKDNLFKLALILSGQCEGLADTEKILLSVKLYIATEEMKSLRKDLEATGEVRCSICGNYSNMMINNDHFKDVCNTCASKITGEFYRTPIKPFPCKH